MIRPSLAVMLLACLAGCSNTWTAALEWKGTQHPRLLVQMRSTLGDEFAGTLEGRCLAVRIRQSPKRPNQITITILDGDGKPLGTAQTHDLANRRFDIPLAGDAGAVTVHPNQGCPIKPA